MDYSLCEWKEKRHVRWTAYRRTRTVSWEDFSGTPAFPCVCSVEECIAVRSVLSSQEFDLFDPDCKIQLGPFKKEHQLNSRSQDRGQKD